ncbi:hypothetical protein IW262DRAFT_1302862 [Armillaria fumosa]|nr:hypothetical protein IW262DRAFT_1302862 [Armillaria fumosa]
MPRFPRVPQAVICYMRSSHSFRLGLAGALRLDNTVGTFEISVTIAALNDYQRDPWYMKALARSRSSPTVKVATVFVGNLFHQLCLNHSLYTYTVTHWGDIEVLLSIPCLCQEFSRSTSIESGDVRSSFFPDWSSSHVLSTVSNGNYLLTCPLAAISVAEFIVNMYAVDAARRITVYTDQVKIKLNEVQKSYWLSIKMMYCVNTGIFTSMAALLTIITLAIWDETMIDHPFYFALPKLYGASLFGMLNARNDIRNGTPNNGYYSNEIPLSLARSAHAAAAPIQSISTHSVDAKPGRIMERLMGKERGFKSV